MSSLSAMRGYTPLFAESANHYWQTGITYARMAAASKNFWRALLLVLCFAVLFTFFTPAHHVLPHDLQPSTWTPSLSLPHTSPRPSGVPPGDAVDWTQYAYCQYVTNLEYLCNSVMAFEALVRLGAKADRLMLYPDTWQVDDSTLEGRLLLKARDIYGAKLNPITVAHLSGEMTWAESFTKLLAFNQTQYKRVLSLDSDATILQPMDELFFLPPAPVAMPRAYWLKKPTLSSQLVLIQPSAREFSRILDAFQNRDVKDFDMEIVNNLYGSQCIVLPHRRYDLITGEFRGINHSNYLGSELEIWNTQQILEETKFVHFSDWPLPKPWKYITDEALDKRQPACRDMEGGEQDCSDRDAWRNLYADFKARREQVCADPPAAETTAVP